MSKALEPGKAAAPPREPCWSCSILSGSALMCAGFFVYLSPRWLIRRGVASFSGIVFQYAFAVSLASLGAVIILDPVLKRKK